MKPKRVDVYTMQGNTIRVLVDGVEVWWDVAPWAVVKLVVLLARALGASVEVFHE